MTDKVELLVDGGKATPGPPIGPALGPLGVNIMAIVKEINEKTKNFAGMKVPVKILLEKDKTFTVTVGTPPTSALIKTELKIELGSKNPRLEKVGDLKMAQAVKIAKMKGDDVLGKTLRDKVSEVIGTCVSMGVTVEGKDPRDVQRELGMGKWDAQLK